MSIVDHYIGVKEYSIDTETQISYHKYIPYEYINYGEEYINSLSVDVIKNYYKFFADLEVGKGFQKDAIFKTNTCGLWTSFSNSEEVEAYHSYFSYDYGNMSEEDVTKFYQTVINKAESPLVKYFRHQELDMGIEGITVDTMGSVLKYIMLFRPNSDVLSYLPDLEKIDNIQQFVDLNYMNIKQGLPADPDSFKSPIRIQFDADNDKKISIELVSAFFQKEYYLSKNSYSGYIDRKNKYFDRMMESGLLTSEEVEFCKQKSPEWQQFSVKFKWEDGVIVDKKLYTFVVVDFEEVA